MKVRTLLASLAACACLIGQAQAGILAMEDFSYDDGALVPNGGWVNQSGTEGTLLVASGEAVVTQDSGSEDAELVFASDLTTGIVTADFDIRVTAPAAMTGTDFEYFAHFSNDDSFSFTARLDVVAPNGSSDYSLGLAGTSSTADATLPVDFAFGASVPVSLSFNLDTGFASLTAGGSTITSTTASLGEIIDSFNLRQSSSSSDETIFVDNLTISSVPEPSSVVMLLMAVCGVGAVGLRTRLG